MCFIEIEATHAERAQNAALCVACREIQSWFRYSSKQFRVAAGCRHKNLRYTRYTDKSHSIAEATLENFLRTSHEFVCFQIFDEVRILINLDCHRTFVFALSIAVCNIDLHLASIHLAHIRHSALDSRSRSRYGTSVAQSPYLIAFY